MSAKCSPRPVLTSLLRYYAGVIGTRPDLCIGKPGLAAHELANTDCGRSMLNIRTYGGSHGGRRSSR